MTATKTRAVPFALISLFVLLLATPSIGVAPSLDFPGQKPVLTGDGQIVCGPKSIAQKYLQAPYYILTVMLKGEDICSATEYMNFGEGYITPLYFISSSRKEIFSGNSTVYSADARASAVSSAKLGTYKLSLTYLESGLAKVESRLGLDDPSKLKARGYQFAIPAYLSMQGVYSNNGTAVAFDNTISKYFSANEVQGLKITFFPNSLDARFSIQPDQCSGVYLTKNITIFYPATNGVLSFLVDISGRESDDNTEAAPNGINIWNVDRLHFPDYNASSNLVQNPSFETGLRYWGYYSLNGSGYVLPLPYANTNLYALDPVVAHTGQHSLRVMALPFANPWPVVNTPVPYVAGENYTLSFYAKGSVASGLTFTVRGRGGRAAQPFGTATNSSSQAGTFAIGGEWQRYSCSFIALDKFISMFFNAGALGWTADRYVWIDDVQIEKGPMTAFKPTMHQMQLLSSARGNFLEYGQSPDFRLAIRSLPNTAGTVALFVEDFFFHTVLQQYYDFNTDADGKATIALSALDAKVTGAQLRGVFSVSATLQAAGDARPYKDYFRFSVMNFLENKHKNKNLYANMYCYGSGPAGGDGMEWARFFERERARGIGSDVMVDLTQERNRLLNEYGLELFGKSMITDWKNIYEAGHVVLTNVNVMLNPSAEDLAKYEGVCERSASNRPWMNGWHFVSEAAAGLQPLESHPEAYAKFNLATLRGVKRGNPNAQVLLDGGSYSILPSECKRMEGYIQAVKALDPSAIPQYHGIGGHYYCDIPESSDLDVNIDEYIKMLDRNGCTNYTIDMVEGGNYSAINIPSEGLTPYICMSANNWWIALPSYHIGKGERISAAFMARTWLVGLKYQDRVKHMAGYLTPNRKLDVDFTPTVFDKIPNTLGRLLGDASFYKDIRFAPFCRCYVFKDDTTGAPIAAVWGHKESVDRWKEDPPQVKFNFGGQAVQFIDLMENEVSFPNDADGKTVIPMSPFPIFIKGAVGTIDSLCQALSNAVTVSPNPAPAIAVQPQSLRGNPGTPASFTVTATGTSPLFYQWQKNTTNIPSATKQVYTIAAIALGDAGSYRCIVSNMAGQVTSAAATLTVHAPPAIAVQPRSLTNNPGTAASFTVTAAGTAPLFYQWQKNAIDINLATNAAYTIAAIALGDAGSYRCIVRNMAGQVTSAAATLSVNDAPTVSISSPANGTVFTAPAAITINANASDIDGSVTKVEFYNGATKIGEDTTSPYSFAWANVPPGSYTLTAKATDNGGAIRTSAPVTLTVMKVDQAITFAALADKTYGDAAFALTATASGGLPVSYASDNPSVATVSGSTVTIVGAGSAVITASQAGDGAYNAAANVSRTLTVSRKALTVKANNKSRLVGQANPSFDAAYTGLVGSDTSTSIGLTVAFACAANSESPAGTYPIEPSGAAFTANYTVTYQNGTLTVNAPEAITTIAVTPANALAPVRESRQFTAVAMDQFGNLLSPQPAFSWAVTAGGGTIDQAGLFTATNTVGMFTVTASSGGKSGAAQGHALIGSLVGWWLFDEINGTSAVDSSGFANNAALSGGATWLPIGQVYGAVRLDGGANAQVAADNVAVDTASGATNTVYFWMKWDGGNDQMPFAWDNGYGLHLLDGALGITTGNGDILGIASTGLSNRWVHVAAVFPNGVPSATNAKIYIDGVEQALSMRMGTATQDRSATPRWCMSGVGGVSRFKGAVDDLRIWRMRLTAAQVARPVDPTLWLKLDETNGTIAADSSGYVGHNGMLVNGPVWTSGAVNGALNFDGINDYVVADTAGLYPYPGFYSTVAFWMKWNGGNYQMPFGWNGNYDLYLVNGSFGINTAEGNVLGISSEGLAGRWMHVAVVFPNGVPNAGNAKMYINGVLQTLTNRIGMATLSRSAGSKGIISGWDTNATHKFGGAIDDLRVYPRELFAGEVMALAAMGTNRAPVAVNNAYTTAEDTVLTVAAPGVLGNDSDPDGEALTAAKVSDPANGTLVLNANGSFTFTPNANWNGTDTFSYRASDGKTNSNPATVTIAVTPVNDAPTMAVNAAVTPNPVTDSTANLSVLGADDGGEAALTYTWATTGVPPAPVSFSANGNNAARNTTATFTKAGVYSLRVTITDAGGLSATSAADVTVNQAITTIAVMPANALVPVRESRQFTAVATDQFGNLLSPQPAFSWAVTAGGGTIDQAGLFTATNAVGMFTVTASSGGKSGAAQGHALIGSLVGWWLFDEINGTSAADSSGFANNAALSGGATWLPIGQVYGAVRLDGGANAQVAADNVAVDTASGATNTVYFWMKWDGGNDQMPFAWDNGYGLHLLDGALGITTGNGDILGIASTGLSNRWVHVAAVFPNGVPSATNAKIYIDGVEQALSMRMGTATQDRSATPRWCMSGVGGVSRFKGAVDDLRIWRMRLTAAQVARPVDPTLWLKLDETNGTIAADSSGYVGHNGMLVNGPVWTSGAVNGALNFDGINDYVVADTAGLYPYPGFYSTVAFWMKWNGGNYQMPFGWNGNYDLYLVNGSFGINTAEGNVLGISSEGLAGRWMHVAVVFPNGVPNAGNAKMYINGVLQTLTNRIGMATLSRSAGSKGIISGWDTNAVYKFGGAIDDLRVYPRELFAGEVTALAGMGTNRAPVAVNNAYTTAEDTVLTVAAPGVLGNDSDPDGEALTAAKVSDPANGTLVLNANGSFTFTPNANWNGTDTFSYRASDGKTNSNPATVTIAVTPVNDAPTVSITSPANEATFTTPATITINANASDMDGSVTKVEFYNGATRLGEDTTSPYSFAWANVPPGSCALTAKATDNGGAIRTSALVTLTVAKVDQAITFAALTGKTYGDAAFALTATASSGLPVSYASGNSSVATVSGSTVTIVGAGSAVITASQAGDGAYAAANMSRTLTVSQKALSVTAAAQGMIYGAVVPPLTYAVSGLVNGDTAGAVLSGALVTMATSSSPAGTYSITQGTLTANANYNLAFTGANLTVVAEAGMVAWWKLDETNGTIAADSSGYGRTGILVDGPVWTSGKVGGGIWLDGINDYVLVSNTPSLNVQVVTVAAWVKLTANFNNAFVNKELSYEVGIDADGTLKAAFWTTNTTTWSWIDSDVVVGTGVWRHVATSYDGTNVMFYVDGVKVKEKPCPQGGWMVSRTYPLRLGARDVDLNGTADGFVRMSMDDVRIYNKVLTATEVAALAANGLPSPWETQDLGAVGVAGSVDYSDGAFTISASGADVGGTADQFRYVYQLASGDCEIKARVVGVQNVNAGSKAGLMIRETLIDNARNALMAVTAGNGVIAQWRTSTGDNTISNVMTGLTAPYWVRVVRTGTSLAAYRSLDGTTWTAMGTQSVSMATSVYIGLTLTSHTNTNTCTAVIDNVTVTP